MRKKVKKIDTCYGLKPNTMINKRAKKAVKPPRKKPKYLSLRLQLSSEKTQQQKQPTSVDHRQLNLFPLHPENEISTTHEDQNMVNYFFSAADGGATTTLTGLLNSSTTSSSGVVDNATMTLSSSVYTDDDKELLRTALRKRNKERDDQVISDEERWVCYSEVVERRLDEEVTSCAVDDDDDDDDNERKLQKLDLKLDYEKIINAWSHRGSLYIHGDHHHRHHHQLSPQTVPDISTDLFNGLEDCRGNNMGLWNVPEMKNNVSDELKQAQREASVLRYKEKRQNRLFAKRIRYQVRKLNAEKRPRVKGRFVKRS